MNRDTRELDVNAEQRLRINIQRLVKEKGTKLARLSEVVGRTAPWASLYLRGQRPFPFERLDAVGELFGLTAEALLTDPASAATQPASPDSPGLDVDRVTITAEPSEPEISVRIGGPPDFAIIEVVRAHWNTPLVDDRKFIGKASSSFWGPEQMRSLLPLMQTAWSGAPQAAYFVFPTRDGTPVYRRVTWVREGAELHHKVYRLPETIIPLHPVDMTSVLVNNRADSGPKAETAD